MASLNLLFVHEVSYEKKPIFEMHEFPENLAAKGHKVTFLQFDEGFKFWRNKRLPETKTISGRVLPRVKLDIVTPFQFGIPGLDRIWATISVWPVLDRLLKKQKFDAIVLYAVPTYGHQVIQLAEKYSIPVVFRALDVSHLIRKSALSPLIKSAEKYVYEHADVLSANNPALARYCEELGSRNSNTFVNLPPLDVNHFASAKRDKDIRRRLGISEKDRVVAYMGSFFYFSGLDIVLRDFVSFAKADSSLKLLLIGGGEQETELKAIVAKNRLEKQVIFTGFIPYGDLPSYLKQADVAINPMQAREVSDLAMPHKLLQYVSAGIESISTRLRGAVETFGEAGVVTWANDPHDVLKLAVEALNSKNPDAVRSGMIGDAFLKQFSQDQSVRAFENILTLPRLEA
ncbi:MAG: hypothetical protein RL036_617 [Actinomycetota bacterium]|jgi:glycosyltransferase involved in cell wall biosynthesis